MKKALLLMVTLMFLLISCTTATTDPITGDSFTVTFNSDGGSAVTSQTVVKNGTATAPTDPTKDGYTFEYWYLTSDTVEYDFATPVTADITLTAVWVEVNTVLTDEEKIALDIAAAEEALYLNDYELNLPIRGAVYRSTISWKSDSIYVSDSGIILPVPVGDDTTSATITGKFILNGKVVSHTFNVPLIHVEPVVITSEKVVPFENITTEYDVADGNLTLYFEEDGNVPYVKLLDFFDLLEGFIDPAVDFTITKGDGTLEIQYQYYDEDEDQTYDLILTVDANDNTITTNDPGFYWAYVYSTETNYGRHITYDYDNPNNYYEEGSEIVYDLDEYSLDMAIYDGDIVLPYYLVNQLFAGSSYYNVYYNYDGLYGIYALPDSGTAEYRAIKSSSMNGEDVPGDLLAHTFNMLAFDLDYFYGLKDIMEVDTYYDLLYSRIDDLLQSDPESLDYGIRDVLLKDIDEPHTSYGYPSYFNSSTWAGPETNSLTYYGSRFTEWYYAGFVAVDDVIAAKWNITTTSGWSASSDKRPNFWFLDSTTVMLSLDDFYTADIEESATYDSSLSGSVLDVEDASTLLPTIPGGTKYFYYNSSTETDVILEILVKGLDASAVTSYHDALVSLGYTFNSETTTDENKVNGYFTMTVGETSYMVQIAFDEEFNLFYVSIIDRVPTSFTSSWPVTVNVYDTVESDSAVFMEMLMDQIMEQSPSLENIILDLSWNTGGNVGALFRIVGFITDQPFLVSGIDRDTGGVSSYSVVIDGVPNYSNLNWALLITPVTFSAANEMATIFMQNEFGPIIGVQSGGGACSITPILLPNGTAFTMSSNNINAYRTGTGTEEDPYVYHNNEFGIEPDYPISVNDIYHAATLLDIFENYYNPQ